MPLHRRDFMKLLGVSIASLFLTRCRSPFEPQTTCYAAVAITPSIMPTNRASSTRGRLRLYWLRFGELAEKSREDSENKFGQELFAGHRAALDELVVNGEISAPVADLVQEAYGAAVEHVWRSNAPITCYEPMRVDYTPSSASVLVDQATALNQIAEAGTVDPATLAKAQSALEHDLSFYALTDEEVQELYGRLIKQSDETGQPMPSFEALTLELTPEAKEATQFIVDLLASK